MVCGSVFCTGQWSWKGGNLLPYRPLKSTFIIPSFPQPRYQAVSWSNRTHFHIFGGLGSGTDVLTHPMGLLNDHWAFEYETEIWHVIYNTHVTNEHGTYGIKNEENPLHRPGSRREAVQWTLNGTVYMFGGFGFAKNGDPGFLNDIWRFNYTTELWTWISGFDITNADDSEYQIGGRVGAVAWVHGESSLWLFSGFGVYRNDEAGFEVTSRNDMWRFDLKKGWYFMDGYTKFNQPLNYPMKGRTGALIWKDNNHTVWMYGGYDHESQSYLSDLWSWNETHTRWALKLDSLPNRKNAYIGPLNVASNRAYPSSRCCSVTWVDSKNNMFLFGGYGLVNTDKEGFLDDLWALYIKDDEIMWSYAKRQSSIAPPIHGERNAIDPLIWPGKRAFAAWTYNQSNDTLWLFGAMGKNIHSEDPKPWIYYQDLWTFRPPTIRESDGREKDHSILTPITVIISLEFLVIIGLVVHLILRSSAKRRGKICPLKEVPNKKDPVLSRGFTNFDWSIQKQELKFGAVIGRGSSGIIYKGKWRGQNVAIKKLLPDRLIGEREGAIREAQIVVGIRPHLNVIRILGVCITDEDIYIVMNLMYTSLDKLLYDSTNVIEPKDIYKIVKGVVAGMVHLENENICHRDLAARNICLDRHGVPAITDFGMSRKVMSSKEGKTVTQMGPVAWMAPECFKQIYSTKSDVWSFGCLLYEILARKPPHHESRDLFELAVNIRDHHVKPEIDPNWDAPYVKIMKRCWRSVPEERPSFLKISQILEKMIGNVDTSEDSSTYNHVKKKGSDSVELTETSTPIEEAYVEGF